MLVLLGALALLAPAAASAYGWPIKPFYQQHAIRGYFNDPRLSGPETGFHFGVDISAPDGTPVYAVEPGRVRVRTRAMAVSVFPKRGGHLLSYWHVVPAVATNQRVRRHQLIGHVVPARSTCTSPSTRTGRTSTRSGWAGSLRTSTTRPRRSRT